MATSKLADILALSQDVDIRWNKDNQTTFLGREIVFTVPSTHSRFNNFRSYKLSCNYLSPKIFSGQEIIVIDEKLINFSWLKETLPSQQNIIPLSAQESKVKEISFLNTTLSSLKLAPTLVGIGGGVVLNTVGYLAEQLHSKLIYIPTTPISMSDSSTGGKVRVHRINSETIERNFYKSFYEPDFIIVDPRFLETLELFHFSYGLAEIVKHAFYQSPILLQYLLSEQFPF
jgi:3-dehydroquinate synthetase